METELSFLGEKSCYSVTQYCTIKQSLEPYCYNDEAPFMAWNEVSSAADSLNNPSCCSVSQNSQVILRWGHFNLWTHTGYSWSLWKRNRGWWVSSKYQRLWGIVLYLSDRNETDITWKQRTSTPHMPKTSE